MPDTLNPGTLNSEFALFGDLAIVILAAGKGTRMKRTTPKPLTPFGDGTLLSSVLNLADDLRPKKIIVVLGHGADLVEAEVARMRPELHTKDVDCVLQELQLGTGHAVSMALPKIINETRVLVLYSDAPLIEPSTLDTLLAEIGDVIFLGGSVKKPFGYGRVILKNGRISEIVEEAQATDEQKKITVVNSGVLVGSVSLLRSLLHSVEKRPNGEYYLTDCAALCEDARFVLAEHQEELYGINTMEELLLCEKIRNRRMIDAARKMGMLIKHPKQTYIRSKPSDVSFGVDGIIDGNTIISGKVFLGNRVSIGANCILHDVTLGDDVVVHPFSHIEGAEIKDRVSIGPYARIRPGTTMEDDSRVGNFVEVKKSSIGPVAKVNHLSYIGDTTIGANTNIGAGTITCNYDGKEKHQTTIEDDVFIGSGVELVAPVVISRGATIGAGTTVRQTVAENTLVVGQPTQKVLTRRTKK